MVLDVVRGVVLSAEVVINDKSVVRSMAEVADGSVLVKGVEL